MQNEHILTCTLIRSWYSSKDETHSSSPSTITLVFCLVLLPPDSDGSSRRILLLGWGSMLSIRSFSRFSNRSSSSCLVSFSMVLWSGKWRKKITTAYNRNGEFSCILWCMILSHALKILTAGSVVGQQKFNFFFNNTFSINYLHEHVYATNLQVITSTE